MGEWREVLFSDLLEHIVDNRGKTCPTSENGTPLIATNCIKNDALFPVFEKVRFVSKEIMETWFRGHPQPGDLIFVTKGSPGRVCYTPNPVNFCIAQDMVSLRANKQKVTPKYLFAVLRSQMIQERIDSLHVGTLIPHFKKGDFDKLKLPIPDLETQEHIGSIYYDFCNKIELNRKMNETLEEMARAIFKSWFVDFDPVHAKARGEKPAGMPDEIADLFPSEFQFSEQLGKPIPKGWEVKPLKELIDFNPPRRVKKGSVAPYVEMSNLPENGMSIKGFYSRDFSSGSKFMNGDTLFARITPCLENGKTAYVDCLKHGETGWGSTEFIVMKSKPFVGDFVSYVIARSDWFRAVAIGSMNGSSGRQRASVEALEELLLAVPCNAVFDAYNATVATMPQKIQSSHAESQTLAVLRDSLLPKLISGEIEV